MVLYDNRRRKKVLFPFGYGLGWADLALSGEQIALSREIVAMMVTVANLGVYAGGERAM